MMLEDNVRASVEKLKQNWTMQHNNDPNILH